MIEIAKVDCNGCHACENTCPVDAISMERDDEGFWYPDVNYDRCIKCGLCIKSCSSLNPINVSTERKGFAAYNKDLDVRLQSSSGGIFTLLAQQVLEQGGIVFGAAFDENNIVKHIAVTRFDDLAKLRGSKYVQSEIGDNYKKCRTYLQQGVQVLFSGTPCQITGLKSFLQKEYDNLLTIDIICHGVPSPKVWDMYKNSVSNGSNLSEITFREKTPSWEQYSVSYKIDGNKEMINSKKNEYMKAFLADLFLRPSCYSCKSKTLDRHSDITIGDFWGINNVKPLLNDQKGISFVITHNKKAESILSSLNHHIVCEVVDVEDGVRYNPSAVKSVVKNPKREKFMLLVNEHNFAEITASLTKIGFTKKVYIKIRRILGKIKRAVLK